MHDFHLRLARLGIYLGEKMEVAYDKAYDILYPYYCLAVAEWFKFSV